VFSPQVWYTLAHQAAQEIAAQLKRIADNLEVANDHQAEVLDEITQIRELLAGGPPPPARPLRPGGPRPDVD
jgi:type VI protein secretion system component VasK